MDGSDTEKLQRGMMRSKKNGKSVLSTFTGE